MERQRQNSAGILQNKGAGRLRTMLGVLGGTDYVYVLCSNILNSTKQRRRSLTDNARCSRGVDYMYVLCSNIVNSTKQRSRSPTDNVGYSRGY